MYEWAGIRRLAGAHGHEAMYHETLTQFWVRIVAYMTRERPDIAEFDVFIETFPQALDTRLPHRHWRHDTLWSAVARAAWVEPDLLALPAEAPRVEMKDASPRRPCRAKA